MAPSVMQVFWSLVTVFILGTIVTKIQTLFKYPAAPGPKLALVTRLWYAMQVWRGHFQDWNIEAHRRNGKC